MLVKGLKLGLHTGHFLVEEALRRNLSPLMPDAFLNVLWFLLNNQLSILTDVF